MNRRNLLQAILAIPAVIAAYIYSPQKKPRTIGEILNTKKCILKPTNDSPGLVTSSDFSGTITVFRETFYNGKKIPAGTTMKFLNGQEL